MKFIKKLKNFYKWRIAVPYALHYLRKRGPDTDLAEMAPPFVLGLRENLRSALESNYHSLHYADKVTLHKFLVKSLSLRALPTADDLRLLVYALTTPQQTVFTLFVPSWAYAIFPDSSKLTLQMLLKGYTPTGGLAVINAGSSVVGIDFKYDSDFGLLMIRNKDVAAQCEGRFLRVRNRRATVPSL